MSFVHKVVLWVMQRRGYLERLDYMSFVHKVVL